MSDLRFRPVAADDLVLFQRLATEPDFMGLDWHGFRDPAAPGRRFAEDGYLGQDNSWLLVERDAGTVAMVNWRRPSFVDPGLGIAEQKALVKAGFQFEGTIRAAEFRDGEWRDGLLYSRLRTDPPPSAH